MSNITDVSSSNKTRSTVSAFSPGLGASRASSRRRLRGAIAASAGALALFSAFPAFADGNCADKPTPIYGLGGSATKPLLGKIAAALAAANPPRTIVYQAPGACLGINGLISGTPITGTATYWDTTGAEQTCKLPDTGQAIDFANMGNSAASCPGVGTLPEGIGDFLGAVNAYTLIVPKASSQLSISSEAAYFAFGFGQTGQAQPWVDETQLFKRDANSAAQLFIAIATGVPAEKFKGIDTKSNSGTITGVAQATKPEAALGLVSGEVADANRASVRILAYQHKGQRCGYLPDSTATSFDKRNVRNGQYYLWAPLHFFAKVDAQKKIVNPEVANFIGLFTGEVEPPAGVDILAIESKAGNVPKCAMNVWRETDLGEVTSYKPEKPCGCYFESITTGTNSCTACSDNAACPSSSPVCRYGFCEAR